MLATVHIHSHHLVFSNMEPEVKRCLMTFCQKLIKKKITFQNKRPIPVIEAIFASSPKGRKEIRFHRNHREDIFAFLQTQGFPESQFQILYPPIPKGTPVKLLLKDQREPRDYQVGLIDYLVREGSAKIVNLATGGGKAQPLTAKVLTPLGFQVMGNLRQGMNVISPDGRIVRIKKIHRQGVKMVYELRTIDGRRTECCIDHLWKVWTLGEGWRVLKTLELICNKEELYFLPLPRDLSSWTKGADCTTKKIERLMKKGWVSTGGDEGLARELCQHVRSKGYRSSFNPYSVTCVREKKIAIAEIRAVGLKETQCLSLESDDGLYVTDDFIVTHNTFIALRALHLIGERFLITVLGRYMAKWEDDVQNAFTLDAGDLVVVRGSKQLETLLREAVAGSLSAKIILCSSGTIQRYIKDYVTHGQSRYPVPPAELCATLGVGVRLVDECHQHFHLNFLMELYSHVGKIINLSATLDHSDGFTNRMLQVAYPLAERNQGREPLRYIEVKAVHYTISDPEPLTFESINGYSHVLFEQSILSRSAVLSQYLDLVEQMVSEYFIKVRSEGQKLLIFAATVAMCEKIVERLAQVYPEHSVARYVAEDEWSQLHSHPIVVSTLGSAGTAVDIRSLKTVLLTVSVDSLQANQQALGRLRPLPSGERPVFVYLFSRQIPRQLAYHRRKFKIFEPLCFSHESLSADFTLNTGAF